MHKLMHLRLPERANVVASHPRKACATHDLLFFFAFSVFLSKTYENGWLTQPLSCEGIFEVLNLHILRFNHALNNKGEEQRLTPFSV